MKNKKLFAILTLVCFMFTLMPVAAFAASSYVEVSEDSATWDDSVTVEVYDEVAVRVVNGGNGLFVVDADGDLDQITTEAAISFDEVGTYKVYAAAASDVEDINDELISKAAKLELLMELDSLVDDYATVKVKAGDVDYRIVLDSDNESFDSVGTNKWVIDITANEGWYDGEGDVVATLEKSTNDGGWEVVKNADLTFSTAGYVDVITEDGTTTDRGGDVEFEVVSDRAGEYKVIVKYGTKAKAELTVNVYAEEVANVELAAGVTAPVDVDSDVVGADIEFKFTDASGKACDAIDVDDETVVKITVTDKPADSTVDEDTFSLAKDGDDTTGVFTLNGEFDEEGEYTIKVTLKNGKSASATVKAAEMGEIVGIKYDVMDTPRTIAYGEATSVDKVLAYDAAGVTKSVSAEATFSANGNAVADLDIKEVDVDLDGDGETDITNTVSYAWITAENDDDYIGKTITVFAEYEDFVTSTTLTVVDKASGISYADTVAEVGVNTEIKGAVVDSEGNRSAITSYIRGLSGNGLVLDKPENAVAIATWEVDSKGNVVLSFLGSEKGDYKVQVAVSYTDGNGTKRFISGIANITVGAGEGTFEDIVVVSIGADKMIVNSEAVALDVAPFIENGRTMMQFNVLYVFGIDVEWVAETQSIVAEGEGLKVVMQLGSKVAVVNGEEVALDVAPYTVNGRTVVPVGFITGLLDITPTFTYNADGTIADILFTK